MNRNLLLLIIVIASAMISFAQPPPRTADVADKQNYILKSDGFKADFPAKPKREVVKIDTAYGKTDFVRYQLPTALGFYEVSFIDFPTVQDNIAEVKLRFESARDAILSKSGNRLISENEILFGDNPGVDFIIEGVELTFYTRLISIKQRFIQLIYISKGKISKLSPKLKEFNKKKVDKFYNSFSITNLPEASVKPVKLPEDFGITVENYIFRSKFFGFQTKIPEGWEIVNKEQTEFLKELGVQTSELKTQARKDVLEESKNSTEFLLVLSDKALETGENKAMVIIGAEEIGFPNFLPEAVVRTYTKMFLEPNEQATKKIERINIGGAEFSWVEIFNKTANYKQRLYVANLKGLAFELLIHYRDESDLKVLTEMMQTMKFDSAITSKK